MIKLNLLKPNFRTPLQKALDEAKAALYNRPFSQRHPELGKMVNCQVCGTRHRANERKCEQVFTYRIGDYEIFREDEKGDLVPAYRTAVPPDSQPTIKQVVGAAAFHKKRFKQHPSKVKLLFIERTREVFRKYGFYLLDEKSDKFKQLTPQVQKLVKADFQEDLQRAKVLAARQLRRERELRDRAVRHQQDKSRRINRGLLAH